MVKEIKQRDIDEVRKFFVDPAKPESADELAKLSCLAIKTMAQIYATRGKRGLMSEDARRFLSENEHSDGASVRSILGKLLARESSTRHFNHEFSGQIHPQGNQVAVLGHMIAAYMNNNTVVSEVSPEETSMEGWSLDWMADVFGYDKKNYSGNITSGGTTANLLALWVARERLKQKQLKEGTWKRSKPAYVIGTKMEHYSIAKSTNILGDNIIFLEVGTKDFKTDVDAMDKAVTEVKKYRDVVAIVGMAGETETGLIDDLDGLADVAEKHGVFFHVDGAYGGPFILSSVAEKFKGIDRADSITVDPHKMLYVPYQAGAVLFKDKREHMLVSKDMRERAVYLLDNDERYQNGNENNGVFNFGTSRVEGSMGSAGAISTWATINLLGKEGFKAILDHTIELTEHAYEVVAKSEVLRPVHEPETNTLLVGLRNNSYNPELHNNIVKTAKERADKKGHYVSCNGEIDLNCGPDARSAFRVVPMHPFSTKENIEETLVCLEEEIVNQTR